MAKKYIVTLTPEEQAELHDLLQRRNEKSSVTKRAYVLLAADRNGQNLIDSELALRYQMSVQSIENIRRRFVEEGFRDTVYSKKRTLFKEKLFDGRVEAQLIALRCSDPPPGHSAWTLHLLAGQMVQLGYVPSISHESVRQLLKKKSAQTMAGQGVDH